MKLSPSLARWTVIALAVTLSPVVLDEVASGQAGSGQVRDVSALGGDAYLVAASPHHPGVVLFATERPNDFDILYRSVDNGRTAVPVVGGPETTNTVHRIGGMDFDPAGTLFGMTRTTSQATGIVWVSQDAGQTWVERPISPIGPGFYYERLSVSPNTPDHLWLTSSATRILRSTDGGLNWTAIDVALPNEEAALRVVLHPTDPMQALIVSQRYLHRTDDGGATWIRHESPLFPNAMLARVTFVGDRILAGRDYGRLFASDDGGATWSSPTSPRRVTATRADLGVPGRVLIACHDDGIYESLDSGTSWNSILRKPGDAWARSMTFGTQGDLMLATDAFGLLRWNSGADTFLMSLSGPRVIGVADLAVDPSDRDHWAALAHGLEPVIGIESRDEGRSWFPLDLPEDLDSSDLTFDTDGRLLVAGLWTASSTAPNIGAFRRAGDPWEQLPVDPSSASSIHSVRIAVSPSDPDLVVVSYGGTTSGLIRIAAVVVSEDGGAHWTSSAPNLGLEVRNPRVWVLDGAATPRIVLLVDVYPPDRSVLAYSDDLGGAFVTSRIEEGFRRLATAGPTSQRLWLGSTDGDPLARSDDAGTTWTDVGTGDRAMEIAASALDPDVVVRLGDCPGEFVTLSTDGGSTWETVLSDIECFAQHGLSVRPDDSEILVWSSSTGARAVTLDALVGRSICGPAATNASGRDARIVALGSDSIAANDLRLRAERLPRDAFGYFLTSPTGGFVANPGGSYGSLCLGGSIGRYVNSVQSSGSLGVLDLELDLTQLPQPTSNVAAMQGDVWTFQAWFRDELGGVPGSNFTDAVEVTIAP